MLKQSPSDPDVRRGDVQTSPTAHLETRPRPQAGGGEARQHPAPDALRDRVALAEELAVLFADSPPGRTTDGARPQDDAELWELAAQLAEPPPRWEPDDGRRWAETRRAV